MTGILSSTGFWAGVVVSYLIGAVPFGYIIAKARGIDIREVSSGNIGATNVARALSRKWGHLVLGLDLLKGLCATALLPVLALHWELIPPHARISFAAAAGVAAVIGHIYPVYLLFKGGKGVATAIGVFGGLLGYWMAIPIAAYGIAARVTDYVSAGSIAFAAVLPVTAWAMWAVYMSSPQHYWVWGSAVLVALFVIWRHRGNIKRLWLGTEPRRSSLKDADPTTGSSPDG